jgi:hypothetical protein
MQSQGDDTFPSTHSMSQSETAPVLLGRQSVRKLCADDLIRHPETGRMVRVIAKDDDGGLVTLTVWDAQEGKDFFATPITTVFKVWA